MQGGVELAILHQIDRFAEGQIFDLAEILIGNAGGGEDGAGIEFGARFWRAHRQPLALQVRQGLDAAFLRRDDLHEVGIDRGEAAQFCLLGLEACFLIAFPGKGEAVAERESDLAFALLQEDEIFDRGLGGLHRRAGAFDLFGEDFRYGDAHRVIDARGAAGEDADEVLGAGGCAGGEGADQTGEKGGAHRISRKAERHLFLPILSGPLCRAASIVGRLFTQSRHAQAELRIFSVVLAQSRKGRNPTGLWQRRRLCPAHVSSW